MAKVVLDTNIVRGLGAGEVETKLLAGLATHGISVHLSDTAATELIEALRAERFPWAHWLQARAALFLILSRSEPILLGGQQGLQTAGLPVLNSRSPAELSSDAGTLNAAWRILRRADSLADLFRIQAFGPDGRVISISPDLARDVVGENRRDWISGVDEFYKNVLAKAPSAPNALPRRGDSQAAIEACVEAVREKLDEGFEGAEALPSVRMDAFLRVRALLLLRRLRLKNTYNPKKRANDAFDLDLLKYLSFPAAICTLDGPLVAAVNAAQSWQRIWIVRPADLARPDVIRQLAALDWPRQASPA